MYDIVIIGAGWAGLNACLTAKSQGLKVALVDRDKIGGTCLNYGCIPTKALIQSARVYSQIRKAKVFGIDGAEKARINWEEIRKRKDTIVKQLGKGIEFRLKGADFFNSPARIVSSDTVQLKDKALKTKSIIIATGSRPREAEGLKFDGKTIISSREILQLPYLPEKLLILGGGYIGCEFASLFSALGSEVTISEMMARLLPEQDSEISRKLETVFKKRGIRVLTNSLSLIADYRQYDAILISVGRSPLSADLGLDEINLRREKDKILVDQYLKTNIANIYAAGDCTGNIMLAHFAAYQGRIAATNISARGEAFSCTSDSIPNCVFTDPEIAAIGLSEEKAREGEFDLKIYRFDFMASGMARILEENEGFIKIIIDNRTKGILGASIIGPRASELVGIISVAMQAKLKLNQLRDFIFTHPSLSESITDSLR